MSGREGPAPSLVRVATFNIRHGLGRDGVIDLDRTASAIRATRADVVGLQEVDRGLPRSRGVDQARALGELTGMQVRFCAVLHRGGGSYGNAVMGAGVTEVRCRTLPRVAREQRRGALTAEWSGAHVMVTHLATSVTARRAQTLALADMCGRLKGPVLLLGDMNQGRLGLRPLLHAGLDPGPGRQVTRPAWPRRRQIDFVLGGHGARVLRTATVATDASDHLPLVAEVIFAG